MLVLGLVKDGSKEIFIDIEKFVVLIAQIASIFVYLLFNLLGQKRTNQKVVFELIETAENHLAFGRVKRTGESNAEVRNRLNLETITASKRTFRGLLLAERNTLKTKGLMARTCASDRAISELITDGAFVVCI